MSVELLGHRVQNQERQSCWTVRRTYDVNGLKVRTTIRNDSYKFQSDYYVEVFSTDTLSWNRLHTASNDTWHEAVDALQLESAKVETLTNIDKLADHLVAVAEELLS